MIFNYWICYLLCIIKIAVWSHRTLFVESSSMVRPPESMQYNEDRTQKQINWPRFSIRRKQQRQRRQPLFIHCSWLNFLFFKLIRVNFFLPLLSLILLFTKFKRYFGVLLWKPWICLQTCKLNYGIGIHYNSMHHN